MTVLAELSYFFAGLVAVIGALRLYYQMNCSDETPVKGTVFYNIGFCFSFLMMGVLASVT